MSQDLLDMWSSLDDTPVIREEILRAPMPYVGSKSRTIEDLLPHLPYTDTFIDGFGGSGSVTLARRAVKFEVFNDKHSGIVSFYRCIRDKNLKDELLTRLEATCYSREEYIWSKETWEHDEHDDIERAARWYYTAIYSFAGVGRNFGRALNPKASLAGNMFKHFPQFQPAHERFKNIQIESLDWRQILQDYDSPTAVIYLDPPYYGKNVYRHNMTKQDHIDMCDRIFQCKGFVAVSGFSNPIYDQYPWDRKFDWPLKMSVATKAINTDTSGVTRIGNHDEVDNLWIKDFG